MQDKDYLENDKEKDTQEGVIHTESTEQEEHDYERFCFLCRRPESQAGKLITLTDGISVCPDCMQKTMDTIQNGNIDFSRLQGVNFMNFSDLQNMMSNQQQVKKKKPKKEGPKPAFDIRSIPAPHKLKASLDEFVIGQLHLLAIHNLLLEDPQLITDGVPSGGDLQRGHGIQIAGSQPPQASVAKAGVRL